MFKAEASMIFAILAAGVQAAVILFTENPGFGPDWILPALTVLAGFLTRRKVFSEQTLEDAGLSPPDVEVRAERTRALRAADEM